MTRFQALLLLLLPLTLWALYFLLIYVTQATGCRLGWHEQTLFGMSALRFILIVQLLGCVLLASALAVNFLAKGTPLSQATPITKIGLACAVAAVPSTLLSLPGVFWLSLCN